MGTDWPMSAGVAVGPAFLLHHLGEGSVVTFAASLDFAAASEHSLVEARELFASLALTLIPNRRIAVSAPANVEAIVTEDQKDGTLRVHLLAYNPTPRTTPPKNRPYVLPGLIEDKPIFRAKIVAKGVASIQALNPATVIDGYADEYTVTVEDVHEVLLLKMK